jgi:hypothetical protein
VSLYILTLSELKSDLGIADTTDDSALTRLMEGLQARFDSHLDRKLLRMAGEIEILSGGVTQLLLARFPVETVASVHVSFEQAWDASTLVAAADYTLNQPRGRLSLRSGYAWPDGEQNIRVIYTGGFVAAGATPGSGQTAMPEDLRRAFLMQASFEWRNRTTLGKTNISAQGISVAISPAKFLPEVTDCLEALRRIV